LPNAKATIRPGSILNQQGGSIFDQPEQSHQPQDIFQRTGLLASLPEGDFFADVALAAAQALAIQS
jgi:hypothetical protein